MQQNPERDSYGWPAAAVVALALAGTIGAGLFKPHAHAAGGAPDAFMDQHARRHVGALARAPHPVGTTAHRAAADYLQRTLSTYPGLEVDVQEGARHEGDVLAYVRNVLARIPGTDPRRALLLVAHYDSWMASPGAGDNAAGVAAVLEAARVITRGPRPRHSVIFLFTDAEELGLMGAKVFASEHPWAPSVRVVLNFDGRGTSGPSAMFQTGERNGWLVEELFESAGPAYANSAMPVLFQFMPNNTDFTVFRNRGFTGLNFAFGEGADRYHSSLDTPDALDARSMRHHGAYAVNLTKVLANADLDGEPRPAIYFNVPGSLGVIYSAGYTPWLLAGVVLAWLLATAWAVRRGSCTIRGIAFGAFVTALATGAAFAAGRQLLALAPHSWAENSAAALNSRLFVVALICLQIAVAGVVWAWSLRRTTASAVVGGALVLWVAAAAAASVLTPGASYLFLLPAACGSAILAVAASARGAGYARPPVLALAAAPAVLLVAQMTEMLATALGGSGVHITALLVVPTMAILTPHLRIALRGRAWGLPLAAAGLGLACGTAAIAGARFDAAHPRFNHLFHVTDFDAGTSRWVSLDQQMDAWTRGIFGAAVTRAPFAERLPAWYRRLPNRAAAAVTAPGASLPAPDVTIERQERRDGGLELAVRIRSPRRAPEIAVYVNAEDASLEPVRADGSSMARRPDARPASASADVRPRRVLYCYGVPADGVLLLIRVPDRRPLQVQVMERSYELPAGVAVSPRPRWMAPVRSIGDGTLSVRTFTF